MQYAGGGGGSGVLQDTVYYNVTGQGFAPAGGGNGPYYGFSNNQLQTRLYPQTGFENTGGGGGGGSGYGSISDKGNAGGSGIVVLRYPSYLAPAASSVGAETYIANGWRVYKFVTSGTITF